MHKFSIIFAFISSIFPAMTYPIEACGIEVTINRNHAVRTVTCAECRTFTDFAMFGGALLSQTSAISIPVENSSGDRAVVSIQRYISHPTGANISADILRRLGLQIDLPDPDRSGITVDTVKGYVFGSRWDNRRTLDRSLEAKCNDIEKQQQAKEQQNDDLARLSQEVSSRGHRPSGDEVARLTGRAPSNRFGRNSRYNYISCYTVWGPNGSTTRCPRPR
jgi:hypothetical protein